MELNNLWKNYKENPGKKECTNHQRNEKEVSTKINRLRREINDLLDDEETY